MQKISSEQYVRNFVRDSDYNLYLLHFFAPRRERAYTLALMALHCELRDIPKKATDPTMMLIRLQWWRDEIDKGDNHADSPILNELPKLDYDGYFNRIDQSMRGQDVDIEELFYALLTSVIKNKKQRDKFTKKLMHHDQLDDTQKFRALRLWLGV